MDCTANYLRWLYEEDGLDTLGYFADVYAGWLKDPEVGEHGALRRLSDAINRDFYEEWDRASWVMPRMMHYILEEPEIDSDEIAQQLAEFFAKGVE